MFTIKKKHRVYITGDCHADWHRLSSDGFPDQKDLTKDDFLIICGDFGLWHDTKTERWWFDWLNEKSYTVLFVDGNHENFDRLNGGEFEVVDFHGGKAHKIRENIYHLMRGYLFELCGKTFFTFGGAQSHDISDGILDERDFKTHDEFLKTVNRMYNEGKMIRVNHLSWWKEELPSDDEMNTALQTLSACRNNVDYIITHCAPQTIADKISNGWYQPDRLTDFLDSIADSTRFKGWYLGHYHINSVVDKKYHILYETIERVV